MARRSESLHGTRCQTARMPRLFLRPRLSSRGEELSERFIARLKQLTEKHDLPWNYAPLHRHLHQERDRGVFQIDLANDCS